MRWNAYLNDLSVTGTATGLNFVPLARLISTTSPLSGGGDLSTDRTIAFANQSANTVLAGPVSGGAAAPGFRALVTADIPALAFVWRAGVHFDTTPTVAESTIPLPVSGLCASNISTRNVSITALTKGTNTMTFNAVRYSSAGTSQGNLFGSTQTYSNTGNNRQDFTVNVTVSATDYFRFNFVTVNGQDDLTIVVEGRCDTLP
jgi:hypothetical protein